ncbi:MgtC/SapB family protein [Candidatus Woesearchaeota archaeon]|nr:MAG: MgtC/SapB family protein [Candidatus Woesearchaeota archaeon]
MLRDIITGLETRFLVGLFFSLLFGYLLGTEREYRGKVAGVGTTSFVIGGSFIFTLASQFLDPSSPARVASYVVAGVGFIGAGLILKSEGGVIRNLTTAAEIWFSAAIGMCIGLEWYSLAFIATMFSFIILKVPHIARRKEYN